MSQPRGCRGQVPPCFVSQTVAVCRHPLSRGWSLAAHDNAKPKLEINGDTVTFVGTVSECYLSVSQACHQPTCSAHCLRHRTYALPLVLFMYLIILYEQLSLTMSIDSRLLAVVSYIPCSGWERWDAFGANKLSSNTRRDLEGRSHKGLSWHWETAIFCHLFAFRPAT